MEGDLVPGWMSARRPDFYPRPPHGGRHRAVRDESVVVGISIHALRMEGDISSPHVSGRQKNFYPRPRVEGDCAGRFFPHT